MSLPFDIVIYALVAVGLVVWLRGVLGTRHGDERQRPNPFAPPADAPPGGELSASQRPQAAVPGMVPGLAPAEDRIGQIARLSAGRTLIARSAIDGLREIARLDRGFDIDRFFQGAQDAFILIVEAFAKGDREALRGLLHDSVYESFEGVISGRESRGEKAVVDVHALRRIEITKAAIENKSAFVTLRFTADETVVVRDENDKIVQGNPDRVTENIDLWTFARDLRSRDPTWFLHETREEH